MVACYVTILDVFNVFLAIIWRMQLILASFVVMGVSNVQRQIAQDVILGIICWEQVAIFVQVETLDAFFAQMIVVKPVSQVIS